MSSSNSPMKRSLKNSSNKSKRGKRSIQVPRGTPHTWFFRWQLALSLKDRLEMINGGGDNRRMMRLASHSTSIQELIRRYSNDTML